MKIFVVTSSTNYGDVIYIINAEDEQEARETAKKSGAWDYFSIEELDCETRGLVFAGGGE
jgi:hypothetical protein